VLALAAGAWVVTIERIEGMDGGLGTKLGGVSSSTPRLKRQPCPDR
jgi:hypothetical protein